MIYAIPGRGFSGALPRIVGVTYEGDCTTAGGAATATSATSVTKLIIAMRSLGLIS
jgi:hypothetical protein